MNDWSLRLQQERAITTIEVGTDVPSFLADRALLKRVFGNLIQNSLVHSSSAVELRVFARTDPRGVLFTVADNGPGIPPQYHEVIFHKFERVKTPNVPRVRSSGLGLAFCRLVVEAHGGRIWVQSTEGQGSAFHILLPLRPASAPIARASVGVGATT
jgi:signal transduction histidine kinase